MGWLIMPKGDDLENKECEICKKPVKADELFYFVDTAKGIIVHFECEIKREPDCQKRKWQARDSV